MATQSPKSKAKSTPKKTAGKTAKTVKKAPVKAVKAAAKTTAKTKAVTKKAPAKKAVVTKADATTPVKAKRFGLSRPVRSEKVTKLPSYSWNAWLALLYAVQGAAILVFSKAAEVVPITLSYLANDALLSKGANEAVLSPAVQNVLDLDLSYAVAGLLFVLAVAHAIAALRRSSYQAAVATAASPFRWVLSFLAVGGSFLLVGIALGIRDIVSLVALAGFVLASSAVALLAEELARDKSGAIHKTFLYRIHFGAYFAPVLALGTYLAAASVYDGTLPVYVNYLFASVVVLSFALTTILRLQLAAEKKWAEYVYAEKAYLVTAFVLVSATAWQVFAGLLV